jgi:hypothetical protein
VQISNDSQNTFQCTPSSGGLVAPPNSCTIVQISTDGSNVAQCFERSGEAVVSQSCVIQQTNTTGTNHADVKQVVDVGASAGHDGGADNSDATASEDLRMLAVVLDASTQDTTQTASVTQTNGSGSNSSTLRQTVNQRSMTTDAAGVQSQEGHQKATVLQTTDTGSNASNVNQSLAQTANALSGATATQSQNAQSSGPNTDAKVVQTSTLGHNTSILNQANDLRMQSKGIPTVTQTQGSPTGGLNGHVDQSSAGFSTAINAQRERQLMDADGTTTPPTQVQFGPNMCCSVQQSNPADLFRIDQRSAQQGDDGVSQSNVVVGNCITSGTCTVTQSVRQQGGTPTTNSCTAPRCQTGIICVPGEGCGTCTGVSCPTPPGSTFTLAVTMTSTSNTDSVVSSPAGINCGPPTSTNTSCTAQFAPGTPVTLTAGTSCDFGANGSWLGVDSSDGNVASVTMNGNRAVTAQYGNAC